MNIDMPLGGNVHYLDNQNISQYNQEIDTGWGWQRVILLLIILQSIGIRLLPLQGVLISLVICIILIPRIGIPIRQFLVIIILSGFFLILSARGLSSYMSLVYPTLILFNAIFYVRYIGTRWASVEFDLLKIAWLLSLHGLISYLLYKLFPSFFLMGIGGKSYKILGILVAADDGLGLSRATGLCWEPGLLQYVANLSLFLGIKHSWPRRKLAVSFLTVVVTFSTTGIFALAPTILYILFVRRRSWRQWILIALTFVAVGALTFGLFQENIADKLGGTNTSGLIRLRDLEVGWGLIKEKPLLGHGQFDEKYLLSNSNIWAIATSAFSKDFLAESGEFGGGYTNGFLGLLASYGLIIGAFFYWCYFNNRVIQGGIKAHLTFFMISIITFTGEPITYTSWFFFLAFSGLYSSKLHEAILAVHKIFFPYKKRIGVTY